LFQGSTKPAKARVRTAFVKGNVPSLIHAMRAWETPQKLWEKHQPKEEVNIQQPTYNAQHPMAGLSAAIEGVTHPKAPMDWRSPEPRGSSRRVVEPQRFGSGDEAKRSPRLQG
jgi:hypothetical protein